MLLIMLFANKLSGSGGPDTSARLVGLAPALTWSLPMRTRAVWLRHGMGWDEPKKAAPRQPYLTQTTFDIVAERKDLLRAYPKAKEQNAGDAGYL